MSNKRSIEEKINTWIQIIAIICAGVWALYTFVYKEYYKPTINKGHFIIDINMSKCGSSEELDAINVEFFIHNRSERTIHILESSFIIKGIKIQKIPGDAAEFKKRFLKMRVEKHDKIIPFYTRYKEAALVAVGNVFSNSTFFPNGQSRKFFLFHIPKNKYDFLYLESVFPVVHDTTDIFTKWTFTKNDVNPELNVYPKHSELKDSVTSIDWKNPSKNKFLKSKEFGFITTEISYSLWD